MILLDSYKLIFSLIIIRKIYNKWFVGTIPVMVSMSLLECVSAVKYIEKGKQCLARYSVSSMKLLSIVALIHIFQKLSVMIMTASSPGYGFALYPKEFMNFMQIDFYLTYIVPNKDYCFKFQYTSFTWTLNLYLMFLVIPKLRFE